MASYSTSALTLLLPSSWRLKERDTTDEVQRRVEAWGGGSSVIEHLPRPWNPSREREGGREEKREGEKQGKREGRREEGGRMEGGEEGMEGEMEGKREEGVGEGGLRNGEKT